MHGDTKDVLDNEIVKAVEYLAEEEISVADLKKVLGNLRRKRPRHRCGCDS